MSSSLHVRLRRLASGLGSLGLDGGVAQLLDFALLAVLRARQSPALCPIVRLSPPPWLSTHLPLGEPELALAPALGDDALVLLQRAAHDARCDCDVAVVAVQTCQLRVPGGTKAPSTYVRPAAFHANAIVMVVCGLVGVDGFGVADGRGQRLQSSGEISRMPLGACTSRDRSQPSSHPPAPCPAWIQVTSPGRTKHASCITSTEFSIINVLL
jgi:hypothetical protein